MNAPPETVLIGKVATEWPLHAFTTEKHAVRWLETKQAEQKPAQVWQCRLVVEWEMVLTAPVPARLVPADQDQESA